MSQRTEKLNDLELVQRYNLTQDPNCAVVLFERYRPALDLMALNTVDLGITDVEGKKGLVYLTFLKAFPDYEGRNHASFNINISRCIKNALLSERRKQNTQKRGKRHNPLSINTSDGSRVLQNSIYRMWSRIQKNS